MSKKDQQTKTGIWALIVKFGAKFLTFLPKILKTTKFVKVGLLALSFGGYAYLFSWKFAALILISLGIHEQGHVFAMRQMGIKTKGWYAIPFLGGAAVAEDQYKTYGQASYVAMMGPVWGLGLSIACCTAYYITGVPMLAAAAGWMAMINLFNLAPVNPLDGGRVLAAIGFSIHKNLGFAIMILSLIASTILMFTFRAGLFGFLLVIGILELGLEYMRRRSYNKASNLYIERAEESHDRYMALAVKDRDNDPLMKKYYLEMAEDRKKYYTARAKSASLKVPDSMNQKQLVQSVVAFAVTAVVLIAVVKLMGHVPGADLASSFLADK
jgi:Zn-dependent protease